MKYLLFLLLLLMAMPVWATQQTASKTLVTNVAEQASATLVLNVPQPPQIVSATLPLTVASHIVTLTWQAGVCVVTTPLTCETTVSFRVYRGVTSGGPYSDIGNPVNTTFSDGIVFAGTTYFYVVVGVGSDGQESVYSNQVTAVIP